MKAAAIGLTLLALPADAWEFTPSTPCLLTHETGEVAVELTYDPTAPLYSISLTQKTPFDPAPIFSMRFNGPFPLAISTDQHRLSNGGRTLTVVDQGFGNVLNGLQFNDTAVATLGARYVPIPLKDAADAVAAFRACDVVPTT
ncbi:hypothetical protein AB2B41_16155 [Marimonas sp. MJW-29]|uniref:Excinuclease ABC subunit B n=1 Tax=Sulfitobacter sediminis TaxID=3234186 RepID=A0ABV3RQ85_9RHOB